jgi:glucuronate isomerase
MKAFLDDNFLLQTKTAQELYHNYSKHLPIIDYHNHLIPEQIANDSSFENISQVWLNGDHYKWRAMRTNGVNEKYITGDASDRDKFIKWAETVPYTLRNPLYHWTHLELQRYFGITDLLSPKTAEKIYDLTAEKLAQPQYSVRGLLKMLPAFRPDKAMNADDVQTLNKYIDQVEVVTNRSIDSFAEYLNALKSRHDFFAENGCSVSDHGLEQIYAEDYTDQEITAIFQKIRTNQAISYEENLKFKSAMLVHFAEWDHEKGWVQQYHLGALRNNNTRMLRINGPDTGWDSIGDFSQARALSKFLNRLDNEDKLTKTILYNLNPADNELIATMIGNFNDGSIKGKIQFGSAWWFLDQKDGMTKQINALSNMGLLSRLVGMLTDSRSFLSFPRHEYFRRLICDIFGQDIENGELPNDIEWIGKIVADISYHNAKDYFPF